MSAIVRVGVPEVSDAVATLPSTMRPFAGLVKGFAPLVKFCGVHVTGPTCVPLDDERTPYITISWWVELKLSHSSQDPALRFTWLLPPNTNCTPLFWLNP